MLKLDGAISQWRRRVAATGAHSGEDIDELEDHIREQMSDLEDSGLSEEEAFRLAAFRLGDAAAFAPEGAPVREGHAWQDRLLWMAVGLLCYVLAAPVARVMANLSTWAMAETGNFGYAGGVAGVIAMAAVGGLAVAFVHSIVTHPPGRAQQAGALVLSSRLGRGACICATGLLAVAAVVAWAGSQATVARLFPPAHYGMMAVPAAYASVIWSVFLPVCLVWLIIRLRPQTA